MSRTMVQRATRSSLTAAFALLLTNALLNCSCQQRVFLAQHLPSEFAAPKFTSMQQIDLTRLARSPGTSDIIRPGDVLDLIVLTGLEDRPVEPVPARVADDGTLQVPLVGPVPVAGLELSEAEREVSDESIRRGIYRSPQVSLSNKSRRMNSVTVVGAVESPGLKDLPSAQSDLLSALVAAGGLTKDASPIVEVRHPKTGLPNSASANSASANSVTWTGSSSERRSRIDTKSASSGPESGAAAGSSFRLNLEQAAREGSGNLELYDGSVVMVVKQPERTIHVTGLVKKSDQYKIPEDQELRLLDAIALAGGRTMEIADKVQVIRQSPWSDEPIVIQSSVRDAKSNSMANLRLAPGDIVSVEETPTTLVVGTIREFVRFGFTSAIPGL